MSEKYTELVEKLEGDMLLFIELSKAGTDGHGSKTAGAKARKLGGVITKTIKEFRKESVAKNKK